MSTLLSIPFPHEMHPHVFICLPCYNEAENIATLLHQINSVLTAMSSKNASEEQNSRIEGYQILAVDDGSTDRTGDLLKDGARTYPLTAVSHKHNQGLAEAYRTLIVILTKKAEKDDIAVFMDADCTHSPLIIADLVRVASTRADVVVASRYEGAEQGVPLKRRILSRVVNWLIRNFCGISVRDCTSGFRAYRTDVLLGLPTLESKGFEVSAEVLMAISEHRPSYRIEEIPLILHYERKKGPSKINIGKTIKAYVKLLWKHRIDIASQK